MPDTFEEKDYKSFGQFLRFLLFEHGVYPDGSPELHHDRGQYGAAEPLYDRALAIYEAALGPDHPHTQKTRRNYELLKAERAAQEGSD